MNTTAIYQATQALQSQQSTSATRPAQIDIDKFTQALFGSATNIPERLAITDLQKRAVDFEGTVETSFNTKQLAMRPGDMLVTQSTLLHSVVGIDLTAKAAGLVSQSINKLVHIQ
jgi:type III secretion system YscI/HrpB-like protein